MKNSRLPNPKLLVRGILPKEPSAKLLHEFERVWKDAKILQFWWDDLATRLPPVSVEEAAQPPNVHRRGRERLGEAQNALRFSEFRGVAQW